MKLNNLTRTWPGAVVVCCAIVAVTSMEIFAMAHGHNGIITTSAIGVVIALSAGFCGIKLGQRE